MIEIQALTERDTVAAGAALDAAFHRLGMVESLRSNYALQPEHWFVARLDGQVAGVVGAYNYGPFAWIGMMGVIPGMQRRGVGLALMARLVGHLDAMGCPTLILEASAAGQHLYPRLGFLPDGHTLRMERSAPLEGAANRPGFASDRLAAFTPRDLPAVTAFDADAFGAPRDVIAVKTVAGSAAGS